MEFNLVQLQNFKLKTYLVFNFDNCIFTACNLIQKMIKTINHKGLKLLWTKGDGSKLPPENLFKIKKVLNLINYPEDVPKDLEPIKNLRPHLLKGELSGFWSLDVSGNYRITFKFIDGNAYDVDYLDTH
jgi:proteic killer suppression protein